MSTFLNFIIGVLIGIPLIFLFTLWHEGYLHLPMSRKKRLEEDEADKTAAAMFLDMLRDSNGELHGDLSKANLLGADLSKANLKDADLRPCRQRD